VREAGAAGAGARVEEENGRECLMRREETPRGCACPFERSQTARFAPGNARPELSCSWWTHDKRMRASARPRTRSLAGKESRERFFSFLFFF